jgi:hypothetical protein
MPEKKRFGKCDECGTLGSLGENSLSGSDVTAHFCGACEKTFLNHPELSSFFAFQSNKPPKKNPESVKKL